MESFLSYSFLQEYWWFIVSLLGALLVFLLFVQGGQTLLSTLSKTDEERSLLVNVLGRKWEFTFTTLVTFGGAAFAAFPLFYSTSFGGAYWVWMLLLFCFVLQAVSYEFRSKPGNLLGKKTYDIFLFINGSLGAFLLGTAVGTFFTGSEFSVDKANITNIFEEGSSLTISQWQTPYHGLEALLHSMNVCLGLAVMFLARMLGSLYFIKTVDHADIVARARKVLRFDTALFLPFFLIFMAFFLIKEGFAVEPNTQIVFMEKYKYLHNLMDMPVVTALLLGGVVSVLIGAVSGIFTHRQNGIAWAGAGTVATVLSLLLCAGWNDTSFYPSTFDLQHSLTIENSSSSLYSLKTMAYVSLFIPFVLAYIVWAWRAMNRKKITSEEVNESHHKY